MELLIFFVFFLLKKERKSKKVIKNKEQRNQPTWICTNYKPQSQQINSPSHQIQWGKKKIQMQNLKENVHHNTSTCTKNHNSMIINNGNEEKSQFRAEKKPKTKIRGVRRGKSERKKGRNWETEPSSSSPREPGAGSKRRRRRLPFVLELFGFLFFPYRRSSKFPALSTCLLPFQFSRARAHTLTHTHWNTRRQQSGRHAEFHPLDLNVAVCVRYARACSLFGGRWIWNQS